MASISQVLTLGYSWVVARCIKNLFNRDVWRQEQKRPIFSSLMRNALYDRLFFSRIAVYFLAVLLFYFVCGVNE